MTIYNVRNMQNKGIYIKAPKKDCTWKQQCLYIINWLKFWHNKKDNDDWFKHTKEMLACNPDENKSAFFLKVSPMQRQQLNKHRLVDF